MVKLGEVYIMEDMYYEIDEDCSHLSSDMPVRVFGYPEKKCHYYFFLGRFENNVPLTEEEKLRVMFES